MAEFDQALLQRFRMLEAKAPRWKNSRLTSYYPDAPPEQWRLEGGPLGRGYPIITFDQHLRSPVEFPFITVAADVVLEGQKLKPGFGPRIHFFAWPRMVFRILDTGGAFKGESKRIRNEGYEPFDLSTSYAGPMRKQVDRQKFTTYWIDWLDVVQYPADLRRKLTDELRAKYRALPIELKEKYGLSEAVS